MIVSPSSEPALGLNAIEIALTLIAVAAVFAWPRVGNVFFVRIERAFGRLARKHGLSIAVVGFSTLLLRLAVLPLYPIPLPFSTDDFSNLLMADTFSHGRLTNPTPAMWTHFETIHVDMLPTYQSMYFPGEGLVLAAGEILFENPWYGQLILSALMCAGICWMLQAWLPPSWALLGGMLAVLRLGLFSYWINTYTSSGLIGGLAGALVLGALPRLMKTVRVRYGVLMAAGIGMLILARPYEGMLVCIPVAIVLCRWMFIGKNRPAPGVLLRRAAAPLLLIVAAGAWLGYYDYCAFGKPTVLPYTLNRATYAMAPYFIWQSSRPEPSYRHPEMQRFYEEIEMRGFLKIHSWPSYIPETLKKLVGNMLFYTGFVLLPPLIMLRRLFYDRRIRILLMCMACLIPGMLIEIYMIPHYLSPFTAVFYALCLQAMRHLRVWRPEGRPAGAAMLRLIVTICFVLGVTRVFAGPLGIRIQEWPASNWAYTWYGPDRYGTERAQIEAKLEQLPGKQLVFVRESPKLPALDLWVYNRADIDASKVVWAWDVSEKENLELIHYLKDRKAWLVQRSDQPATLSPYPAP
jgi:hypothetical protein